MIHHCGAEVNFLYPYEKLRSANVYGTQEVLRLAAGRAVPVHHVSTLAVVHGMGAAGVRRVTEDTPLDHVELLAMGYPESKWVAEEVVRSAGRGGLPVAVHRPYEISGDTTGHVWNSGAALCALFRVIAELGLAPDLDLALNLLPVDHVAAAIVHLALHSPPKARPTTWSTPAKGAGRSGGPAARARPRDPHHRVRRVDRGAAGTPRRPARPPVHPAHPALHQAGHPGGITVQELAAQSVSPQLDRARVDRELAGTGIDCPPVDRELLDHYIAYFHASGFIPAPPATTGGARRD